MAYADEVAFLNASIARSQRWIDFIEGTNSNTFGPRGANGDWQTMTDGIDTSDTDAAAHRWTGTGGGDAYFAWWRSQFPSADENSTGIEKQVYDQWKAWSDGGSDIRAQGQNEADLTKFKEDLVTMTADRDAIQGHIDAGDPDGDPNA